MGKKSPIEQEQKVIDDRGGGKITKKTRQTQTGNYKTKHIGQAFVRTRKKAASEG